MRSRLHCNFCEMLRILTLVTVCVLYPERRGVVTGGGKIFNGFIRTGTADSATSTHQSNTEQN